MSNINLLTLSALRAPPNEEIKAKKKNEEGEESFRFFIEKACSLSPKTSEKNRNPSSSTLRVAVQLDRIIPPHHTDSQRMHPTTQLKTPNSHTQRSYESRRCSWSDPPPRECCMWKMCFCMVVCRQPLDYWVAPSPKNTSPQPRLPSGFLHSHPRPIHAGFNCGQAPC